MLTNYDRYFNSIEDTADFIAKHTTCFICPLDFGINGKCEDCEQIIKDWLLSAAEVEE